ncbi:MAG: hypothetical protein GY786_25485, partial [Proteobacteria bacterium]|nr:hypothetical protein [Pseudomonadota bacterium]
MRGEAIRGINIEAGVKEIINYGGIMAMEADIQQGIVGMIIKCKEGVLLGGLMGMERVCKAVGKMGRRIKLKDGMRLEAGLLRNNVIKEETIPRINLIIITIDRNIIIIDLNTIIINIDVEDILGIIIADQGKINTEKIDKKFYIRLKIDFWLLILGFGVWGLGFGVWG